MIKAKFREIIESQNNFDKLLKEELNPFITVALSRISKAMFTELRTFEEARIGLCQKYGEIKIPKDEDGNEIEENASNIQQYTILDDKSEIFKTEFSALLDKEVEMPIAQVDPNDLYFINDEGQKILFKANSIFMIPLEFIFKNK